MAKNKAFHVRHGLRNDDKLIIDATGRWVGSPVPPSKTDGIQRLNDLLDVVAGSPTIGAILYSDGTNWVKLPRGTTNQVLTMGSPLLPTWKVASTGGASVQGVWKFDSTTTEANPGAGNFRNNNGTIGSVTEIFINKEDERGGDFDNLLAALAPGDSLYIQNLEDATEYLLFDITANVDNTDWFSIEGTVNSSGSNFTDGKEFGILLLYGGTGALNIVGGDGINVVTGSPEFTISVDSTVFRTTNTLNDIADVNAGSPTIGAVLYNDGTNWLKLPRGTAGQVLTMGSPLLPSWAAASGGATTGNAQFQTTYLFDVATSPPIDANSIAFNSATPSSAGQVLIADSDENSVDRQQWIGEIVRGHRIRITDASDPDSYNEFMVRTTTNQTGYWDLNGEWLYGSDDIPADDQSVIVEFIFDTYVEPAEGQTNLGLAFYRVTDSGGPPNGVFCTDNIRLGNIDGSAAASLEWYDEEGQHFEITTNNGTTQMIATDGGASNVPVLRIQADELQFNDTAAATAVPMTMFLDLADPYFQIGASTKDAYLGFRERTTGPSGTAALGKLWVRDDAPNVLMFTDDTGVEYKLNVIPVGSPSIGDVLYDDGTGSFVRLPRGTAGQVLTMGSPLLPSWQTAAGGSPKNKFDTPVIIRSDTDGAPPTNMTGLLEYYDSDGSDRVAFIGFDNDTDLEIENENHGGAIILAAEDAAGTRRIILDADPDSVTILRADSNLLLECNAGTDDALLATANADVALYYNGTEVARTAPSASGGWEVDNDFNGAGNFERVMTSSDIVRQVAPVYEFNSGTGGGDPGAGQFAFDSGTLGSITTLYIDNQTEYGSHNVEVFYALIGSGDILYFRDEQADSTLLMSVTGAGTDAAGHWTFPVSYISGALPTNNNQYSMQVQWLSQVGGSGSPNTNKFLVKAGSPITVINRDSLALDDTIRLVGSPETEYGEISMRAGNLNFNSFGSPSRIRFQREGVTKVAMNWATDTVFFETGLDLQIFGPTNTGSIVFSHNDTNATQNYVSTTNADFTGASGYRFDNDVYITTAGGFQTSGGVSQPTGSPAPTVAFLDITGGVGRVGAFNWNTTTWQPLDVRGSSVDIIADSGQTVDIQIPTGTNVSQWNASNFDVLVDQRIRDGQYLRIQDPGDTSYVEFRHDGTDVLTTFAGSPTPQDWNITGLASEMRLRGGASFTVEDGGSLSIFDNGNTDAVIMSHDGTDFNITGTNTTDINVTGISTIVSSADLTIVNTSPQLFLQDTNATTDEGNWIVRGDADVFRIQTATDASPGSGAANALRITRSGTTVNEVELGNYIFNVDQTVGAGQDNYVLTYDNGTGQISLEAATGGGGLPGSPEVVTIDGTQTIVGAKTFSSDVTISGSSNLSVGGDITANGGIDGDNIAHAVYTSVVGSPTGVDGWYTLFTMNDSTNTPVLCTLRAYAHTNVTFIAHKGFSTTNQRITVLAANTSSKNAGFKTVEGLRVVGTGTVQARLNGGATVEVEVSVLSGGPVTLPASLILAGSPSGVIYDQVDIDAEAATMRVPGSLWIEPGGTSGDSAQFTHDGTNLVLAHVNTTDLRVQDLTGNFRIEDGAGIRVYEADNTTYFQVTHDTNSTDLQIAGTGVAHTLNLGIGYNQIDITGGTDVRVRDGAFLRIYDSTDTDFVDFLHNGTNFTITPTNTSNIIFNDGASVIFDTATATNPVYISRLGNTSESLGITVNDNSARFLHQQDETDTTIHQYLFDTQSASTGAHRIDFRKTGPGSPGAALVLHRFYVDDNQSGYYMFGGSLRVYNDAGTDFMSFSHDGTDAIFNASNTANLNINGVDVIEFSGDQTAQVDTGIFINSRGDAYLDLRADNTVGGAETNNPYVRFRQDQDAVEALLGFTEGGNDSLGNAVTGGSSNAFMIHNRFSTGVIELAVNGAVGLRVDDSNNVTAIGTVTGSNLSGTNTGDNPGVTSVAAGNGLDFTTITGTGSVTLGTPGSLTASTTNAVTATSHTHAVSGFAEISGTPANNQIAIWTGATDVEGDAELTFDGTTLALDGGTSSQPWLELDSVSTGDNWNDQGAGISVGESGKKGSAAIHMTYNGDGSGYVGMGAVDDTAGTGGRPGASHIDFTYNTDVIGLRSQIQIIGTSPYLRIYDNAGTDYVQFQHNGTDLNITDVNTTDINITGMFLRCGSSIFTDGSMVVNGTGGDTFSIRHNGTDAFIENTGTRYIDIELTTVVEARVQDSDVAGRTAGLRVKDHGQNLRDAGFNDLYLTENNPASVSVDEANIGGVIYADDNTGFTVTLPSSTSSFPIGGVITIINANTSGNITVSDQASYTCFYLDGSTRTDIAGSATIGPGGVATIWRQTTGGTAAERTFLMWGSGITP